MSRGTFRAGRMGYHAPGSTRALPVGQASVQQRNQDGPERGSWRPVLNTLFRSQFLIPRFFILI